MVAKKFFTEHEKQYKTLGTSGWSGMVFPRILYTKIFPEIPGNPSPQGGRNVDFVKCRDSGQIFAIFY